VFAAGGGMETRTWRQNSGPDTTYLGFPGTRADRHLKLLRRGGREFSFTSIRQMPAKRDERNYNVFGKKVLRLLVKRTIGVWECSECAGQFAQQGVAPGGLLAHAMSFATSWCLPDGFRDVSEQEVVGGKFF